MTRKSSCKFTGDTGDARRDEQQCARAHTRTRRPDHVPNSATAAAPPKNGYLSGLDSGGALERTWSRTPQILRTQSLTSTSAILVLGEPPNEGTYPSSIVMETKIADSEVMFSVVLMEI